MIGRWIGALEKYRFLVAHRKREKNQNADALTKTTQYLEEKEREEIFEERPPVKFMNKKQYDALSVYSNIGLDGKVQRSSKRVQTEEHEKQDEVNNIENMSMTVMFDDNHTPTRELEEMEQEQSREMDCDFNFEHTKENEVICQVTEDDLKLQQFASEKELLQEYVAECKVAAVEPVKPILKVFNCVEETKNQNFKLEELSQQCAQNTHHAAESGVVKQQFAGSKRNWFPLIVPEWESREKTIDREMCHVTETEVEIEPQHAPMAVVGTHFTKQVYNKDEIKALQDDDLIIRTLKCLVKEEEIPDKLVEPKRLTDIRKYFAKFKSHWFFTEGGVLARKRTPNEAKYYPRNRLVILPQSLVPIVMYHCHNMCSHRGQDKTLYNVRERFDWMHMRKDIKKWVESCNACQFNKPKVSRKYPLKPILSFYPNQVLQIDHMTLSETESGNNAVLVAIDHFTKFAQAYPVSDYTSNTVVEKLRMNWFALFGNPVVVQSDNGKAFTSQLYNEFMRQGEVVTVHSTTYHPATNGAVERMNRTLCQLLRVFASKEQEKWDTYLPIAMSAYNSTRHGTTGFTPNMLMMARESSIPLNYYFPMEDDVPNNDIAEYVRGEVEKHRDILRIARQNIKQEQMRAIRVRDEKVKGLIKFKKGDLVMIKVFKGKVGHVKKLTQKFEGPYEVTQIYQGGRVIELNTGQLVHYERVQPYIAGPADLILPDGKEEVCLKPLQEGEFEDRESMTIPLSEDEVHSSGGASDAELDLLQFYRKRHLRLRPEEKRSTRVLRSRPAIGSYLDPAETDELSSEQEDEKLTSMYQRDTCSDEPDSDLAGGVPMSPKPADDDEYMLHNNLTHESDPPFPVLTPTTTATGEHEPKHGKQNLKYAKQEPKYGPHALDSFGSPPHPDITTTTEQVQSYEDLPSP